VNRLLRGCLSDRLYGVCRRSFMRDKRRIKTVLRIIRKIWKKYPDFRLMQLLLNTRAHYHTEDDTLLNILNDVYVYGGRYEQKKTN